MRRDSARHLASMLVIFGIALFLVSPPPRGSYWVALLVAPVFLISAALVLPIFSAFEQALPVSQTQLLWARVLTCLTLVWLPMLAGIPAARWLWQPLPDPQQPLAFATLFTACACLATWARVAPRPALELTLWLPACACGVLAFRSLQWQAALLLTVIATLPVLAKIWWRYVPEWNRPQLLNFTTLVWPPLKLIWSSRTLLFVPLAAWLSFQACLGSLTAQGDGRLALPTPILLPSAWPDNVGSLK